ncbi:PREDICTED: subtilisin-like protease SBT1.4 [Ipomoea nil]|uniref:subtilisin-like protease SBT1.4 n=1 Tax=Ipomoea nil TaxID=35883 RepID=UPI0009010557|nr:PREDICTED: subtilisin-like protease SBT1.4 [Ipomoea nil]
MATPSFAYTFLFIFLLCLVSVTSSENQETFIVYMSKSKKPHLFSTHHDWYSSIIRRLSPLSHLLYTYGRVAHGFSARLTPSQASQLRNIPGVISVLPDQPRRLHTTHSPEFLGLAESSGGFWPNSGYGDDVIVGVLDTGIWPERRSFSDEGLSPVPSSWKGECENSTEFPASLCNRKIIGARAFYKGYEAAKGSPVDESVESKSPRDTQGHGTHTASTAAGSIVADASLFGYARGEARGVAVKARIAVYKICWSLGCFDSDILSAFDQAVEDGVHVISLSVGSNGYAPPYFSDSIAIGAFGAMEHGVVVSCSAGNSGPGLATAVNVAPWILTVGASTIDRTFPADVVLGDGRIFTGMSLYSGEPFCDYKLPVVYGGDANSTYCYSGELDATKVAGKIVFCEPGGNLDVEKGFAVREAGGVGMIGAGSWGELILANPHVIPAANVDETDGNKIKEYIKSHPSPTAAIVFRGTVIGTTPSAPRVAYFSSRGPNLITLEILKPDVIAPGVNILAGWTGAESPSGSEMDRRRVEFNIISGTSMSCPHVSGSAALLRKARPTWSHAAIKSALMTTAYTVDNAGDNFIDQANGNQSTAYIHGAGHVDPNRALDPGLVYDLGVSDYVAFLCTIGYDLDQISLFVKDPSTVNCTLQNLGTPGSLNYPAFSVVFSDQNEVKYKRSVKNVGSEKCVIYEVKVNAPLGVYVSVSPTKLVFDATIDTLSYEITFTNAHSGSYDSSYGSIAWEDGVHIVSSPITVLWLNEIRSAL